MKILLVEDDLDLAQTLVEYLALEDIVCDHVSNGIGGEELACRNDYDVLVLDVNLPGQDGFRSCHNLRLSGVDTPVLFLTARDALQDKLQGFSVGSDDYLVKPFEMAELVARLGALSLRRSGLARRFQVADLVLDLQQQSARRGNRELRLSPTLWKLLEVLMRASPQIVRKAELEQALWGDDLPNSDPLKVHLYKLRKWVDAPGEPPLLHTFTNRGVALKSMPTGEAPECTGD